MFCKFVKKTPRVCFVDSVRMLEPRYDLLFFGPDMDHRVVISFGRSGQCWRGATTIVGDAARSG